MAYVEVDVVEGSNISKRLEKLAEVIVLWLQQLLKLYLHDSFTSQPPRQLVTILHDLSIWK